MPSTTPDQYLKMLLGSIIRLYTGEERILSYTSYMNPDESLIEMSHGQDAKLCRLFARSRKKAKEIGEAVVIFKPGHGEYANLVLVFPFGIELASAMRTPSQHMCTMSMQTQASRVRQNVC